MGSDTKGRVRSSILVHQFHRSHINNSYSVTGYVRKYKELSCESNNRFNKRRRCHWRVIKTMYVSFLIHDSCTRSAWTVCDDRLWQQRLGGGGGGGGGCGGGWGGGGRTDLQMNVDRTYFCELHISLRHSGNSQNNIMTVTNKKLKKPKKAIEFIKHLPPWLKELSTTNTVINTLHV